MKKFYVIGIMLIVLLALVACTKEQSSEEATEQTTKEAFVQEIQDYEKDVTTWFEKEVINDEDVQAINKKIEEMKEKIADEDIVEETKVRFEELIQKLEDLKEKLKES
ncbi:hypothetical protein JEZ13_02685 [bacterium]|nr:hypothetical protein [bacterium]